MQNFAKIIVNHENMNQNIMKKSWTTKNFMMKKMWFFHHEFFLWFMIFQRVFTAPKSAWVVSSPKSKSFYSRLTAHPTLFTSGHETKTNFFKNYTKMIRVSPRFPQNLWVVSKKLWSLVNSRLMQFWGPFEFFMIFLFMFSWLTIIFANFLQK